jgi:hypothetical protein
MDRRHILIALLALTFIGRAALGFRSDGNLASRLFDDDSFYDHSVSYHLAHGEGLSVDGIHPTNGIQPLIVVLQSPCYFIAGNDKWLGLRLTFILSAIIDTISAFLIYRLLTLLSKKQTSAPVIGAMLWTFLYPIIMQTMNGLETGLYTMLMIAAIYVYAVRYFKQRSNIPFTFSDDLFLGVLLGLLVLARIDAVFFVACFTVLETLHRRSVRVLLVPFVTFLVSSPWWIYNVAVFGNLMPSGGQAESLGGPSIVQNLINLSSTLADIGSIAFVLPEYFLATINQVLWCASVPIVIYLLNKHYQLGRSINDSYYLLPLLPLVYVGVAFAIYYTAFFHAPYFITRYLQPLRIFALLLASMSASIILSKMREKHITVRIAGLVAIAAAIIFSGFHYAHNFMTTENGDLYQAGLWARAHPSATIGIQQSGIASFVADNVTNLDGKVNTEALNALRLNERGKYIASQRFDYLMDWDVFVRVLVNEAAHYGGEYRSVDSVGLVRMYKRVR